MKYSRYVQPITSAGAAVSGDADGGIYTLTAGQTFYYILGGSQTPFLSVNITGYDIPMVITSITVQDCNHERYQVPDHSAVAGEWINEDPSTAFVGADGTGWSASNGVVAALGTGVGGAMIHIVETAAYRTRIAVVVGGTGGRLRVSVSAKGAGGPQ